MSIADSLLHRYANSWRNQDDSSLENIFTLDATYQEKPGIIFNGIEEIRTYWRENAEIQRDIQVEVDPAVYIGCQAFAEWRAQFFRIDRQEFLELQGIFVLQLRNDRICCFKEYFFVDVIPSSRS